MRGKNPLFLVILNGAFMFASELFKKLTIPCEISFVKLSSYCGTASTNVVRELIGLDHSIEGRHVVIVEDIIETGQTINYTIHKLNDLGAADVRVATLFSSLSCSNAIFRFSTKSWISTTNSSSVSALTTTNRDAICQTFIRLSSD